MNNITDNDIRSKYPDGFEYVDFTNIYWRWWICM